MKPRFIPMAAFLLVVLAAPFGAAASEPEPGKDHPLLSRMPNFVISEYESNFDEVIFPLPDEKLRKIEGQKTLITYQLKEDAKNPSLLQIARNYTSAVKAKGGQVLFDGEHPEFSGRSVTMKLNRKGREIWVMVLAYNDGCDYRLTVLEVGEMKQEVVGGEMRQTLESRGRLTLYINFDTGKSSIRPESAVVIDKVARMMAEDPDLKLRVEGHTDDAGQAGANLRLSLERAAAVAEALVKRGVKAQRLAAAGYGQAQPLVDNQDEEGRAKNRRVELVKM